MQSLDVLTKAGFDAIASSHGIEAAWKARIVKLEQQCSLLPGNPFGISKGGAFRELENARFELAWLRHPNNSERIA